jgi:hypothetical protein
MDAILRWLGNGSIQASVTITLLSLILAIIAIIYLVAFLQGREIAFWPPKIGERKKKEENENLSVLIKETNEIVKNVPIQLQVFKDFSEGGILRVYKDRERSNNPENAENDLKTAFKEHNNGEVKLIGVTLRVFFNTAAPFYQDITEIVRRAQVEKSIKIKAIISHPDSYEVAARAEIEEPISTDLKDSLIVREISGFVKNVHNLNNSYPRHDVIDFHYCMSAPYCTAIIFPDKCYFSPNLLCKTAPVRLPMIIFKAGSHGYLVINEYFEYNWNKRYSKNNDYLEAH